MWVNHIGNAIMAMATRLLVLEDDDGLRASLRMVLEDEGYDVVEAADAERALRWSPTSGVDLMLVDLMLGGMDGFSFIQRARPQTEAPIVVISARDGVETSWPPWRPGRTTTSPSPSWSTRSRPG